MEQATEDQGTDELTSGQDGAALKQTAHDFTAPNFFHALRSINVGIASCGKKVLTAERFEATDRRERPA
ncbi:MAG: hypothetical protein JJU21_02980 [Salinarimonas sp.]|nr:hypothetical protein [Salinarimonas sp.]